MYSDGVKGEQHSREVLSPLLKLLFDIYMFFYIRFSKVFENSFKTAESADFKAI